MSQGTTGYAFDGRGQDRTGQGGEVSRGVGSRANAHKLLDTSRLSSRARDMALDVATNALVFFFFI